MAYQWHAPIDPECPIVRRFYSVDMNDPITIAYGVGSDLLESFERKHRYACKRCQEYGAANIEVI